MTPIHFISLGPGGAEYVTWGTIQLLQQCSQVFCFGTEGQSYAAQTLKQLPITATLHVVDVPMSNDRRRTLEIYNQLADTLERLAREHVQVAVATEGDSGIFATTHYVKEILDSRVQREDLHADGGIKTVQHPGIPSFIAAGALAGLHLVSLHGRLLIVPGEITLQEMESSMKENTTLVIMKLSRASETVKACMRQHPEYHYHFFGYIGTEKEEYINKRETLLEKDFPYFSLMIVQP